MRNNHYALIEIMCVIAIICTILLLASIFVNNKNSYVNNILVEENNSKQIEVSIYQTVIVKTN